MIDHFIGHTGVNTHPEGVVHNKVGNLQIADHTVIVCAADLVKAGVFGQIAGEQQTGLHIVFLDIAGYRIAVQTAFGTHGNQETEPGRTAVLGRFRQNYLVCNGFQSLAQAVPVVAAALDEVGELLQLFAADGSLHIGDLQIVAEVAVDILVVIACGQLAVLPVKTVTAEIILTGGADAVTTPVTVAEN